MKKALLLVSLLALSVPAFADSLLTYTLHDITFRDAYGACLGSPVTCGHYTYSGTATGFFTGVVPSAGGYVETDWNITVQGTYSDYGYCDNCWKAFPLPAHTFTPANSIYGREGGNPMSLWNFTTPGSAHLGLYADGSFAFAPGIYPLDNYAPYNVGDGGTYDFPNWSTACPYAYGYSPCSSSAVTGYLVAAPGGPSAIPEPGTLLLLGSGLLAIGSAARKRWLR